MMRFSVCASSVFLGKPLQEQLEMVARAGMKDYEFWTWWDQDLDKVLEAQNRLGLHPVALCTKFIPLTDPSCRAEYIEALKETIEVCKKLGCGTVISQVGNFIPVIAPKKQHKSIVDGLKEAAPLLEEAGITLVIEPLNTKLDHKGYYLDQSAEAYQIIEEVGSENVKVLFDLYHQFIMNDVEIADIVSNIDKIGHFHMASFPGRSDPMIANEMDYALLCKAIADCGYKGHMGMEYFTKQDPVESLKAQYEALRQYEK